VEVVAFFLESLAPPVRRRPAQQCRSLEASLVEGFDGLELLPAGRDQIIDNQSRLARLEHAFQFRLVRSPSPLFGVDHGQSCAMRWRWRWQSGGRGFLRSRRILALWPIRHGLAISLRSLGYETRTRQVNVDGDFIPDFRVNSPNLTAPTLARRGRWIV